MALDTYSARLGLLEMGTGNQNNSWGTSFNASVTEIIDRAIAGLNSRALTGGTLDLSGSPPPAGPRQDLDMYNVVTGTLTSNQTIILPGLCKTYVWFNATTGNFSLFLQCGAGGPVEIPQGTGKHIVNVGNGTILRGDRDDIGSIEHFGRSAAPAGYFPCDGRSLLRTDHPDLFAAIGTTWGAADGTHFTLPLLTDTGRFLRSSSGSLAVGTYQSNQNLAHTHVASASAVTGTTDNPGNHTHANSLSDPGHTHNTTFVLGGSTGSAGTGTAVNLSGGTAGNIVSAVTGITITNAASGAHTHTVTGTAAAQTIASSGGTEARPESAVVLICIKY